MRLPFRSQPRDSGRADEPIEVNRFEMAIPVGGYGWVDDVRPSSVFGKRKIDELGSAPYMVMNAPSHWGSPAIPAEAYFPLLSTPHLFRLFGELELDRDSILAFANRYGWIGETGWVDRGKKLWIPAIGLGHWRQEIQTMIVAHHLWECVQKDDRNTLRNYFAWHPVQFDVRLAIGIEGKQILPKSHPAMQMDDPLSVGLAPPFRTFDQWLIGPKNVAAVKALGWTSGDLIGPAHLAVMNLVNPSIETNCHPRLYLDKHGRPVGHLTAKNLLGCIWLQFYLSIIGRLKLRLCVVCKKEMDISESRSTRKMHDHCSKSARQQRWRVKKRE